MKKFLTATALVAWSGFAFAEQYTVTNLGTLPGSTNFAEATAINAQGQVVGFAANDAVTGTGWVHAFLYSDGTMHDLGTLPGGGALPGGAVSEALGVNNRGQIVGFAQVPSGQRAFLDSNGRMQALGVLLPRGSSPPFSSASGINSSGQVVGLFVTASGSGRAFLYDRGTTRDLGTLPTVPGLAFSSACCINARGDVAGTSSSGSSPNHAFLFTKEVMHDLGTLGGNVSDAISINDSDQVVGEASTASDSTHAFLYTHGSMRDLGTLPGDEDSAALGINNSGEIVGVSDFPAPARAFVYSKGRMLDLNTLIGGAAASIQLQTAVAINDIGQIVVNTFNDLVLPASDTVYLLTPVPVAFATLLRKVVSAAPDTVLPVEVLTAEILYDVHDTRATCAVLTEFVTQVRAQGDNTGIPQRLDAQLIADAEAIEVAISCH